jgi:hypothetical protein
MRKKVAEEARLHKLEKEYATMFEDNQIAIAAKQKQLHDYKQMLKTKKRQAKHEEATAAAWEAEMRKKVAEEARLHKLDKEYATMFEDNQIAIAAKEKRRREIDAYIAEQDEEAIRIRNSPEYKEFLKKIEKKQQDQSNLRNMKKALNFISLASDLAMNVKNVAKNLKRNKQEKNLQKVV